MIGNIIGAAVSCALPVSWSCARGKGDAAVGDAEHSDDVRPISALMSRRRWRALWLNLEPHMARFAYVEAWTAPCSPTLTDSIGPCLSCTLWIVVCDAQITVLPAR